MIKKILIPALVLLMAACAAIFGFAGYNFAEQSASTAVKNAQKNYQGQEVLNNIFARKSVRSYQTKPVEQEKIDLLVKAAMAAPSGQDKRPWEITVVTDKSILKEFGKKLPSGKVIESAPAAIIISGDTAVSPELWVMDCSAAAQNVLLAAEAMGLGAVWTAAYPIEKNVKAVKEILSMPANVTPLTVIPVGYAKGNNKAKDKFDDKKLHNNKW